MPQLTIRAEQMENMRELTAVGWLDERLCASYQNFAATSPSERRQWIERGLKRARAFRLSVNELLPFLSLEQTFGTGCFDSPEYEWGRRILANVAVQPSLRIRQLKKAAVRRLLDEEDRLSAEAAASEKDE